MKGQRFPLHTRLALAFVALMLVVGGAMLVLWRSSSDSYERDLRQHLNLDVARHLAEHAVPLTPDGVDQDELQGMLMHVMSVNPALEVYLLDEGGRILAYDAPAGHVKLERIDLAPVQALLGGAELPVLGDDPRAPGTLQPISAWPLDHEGSRLGFVYVVVGGETWRATAGKLRGSRQRRVFGAAAVGLLLSGLAGGVFLARRLTRPLRELRAAMTGEQQTLSAKLLEAPDDIGMLARSYDQMARRIEEQVARLERVDRDRREFVASVSHDLRTPLASLEGYLELLEDHDGLPVAERGEYLHIARRRARHLAQLVGQLFELAKLESGDVQPSLEPFSLAELTQDVLQGMRQRAARHRVQLVCRLPRQLPRVEGDIGLLERALTNLLDNALKFTPAGGRIQVRLEGSRDGVAWSVRDDGPGISSDDLPRIFERRFRGSGRRIAPGTGLGLAITRRVLELHGSSIRVDSEEGAGCTFRFVLAAA